MRDIGDPARKLGIEVVDRREPPRGEERVAEVLDLARDFLFSFHLYGAQGLGAKW